jgi:hypothetical protein
MKMNFFRRISLVLGLAMLVTSIGPMGFAQEPAPPAVEEADTAPAAPGSPEEMAEYGGSVGELSAAQALAEMERRRQRRRAADSRRNIQNIDAYTYTLVGPDEAELVKQATLRALKSTAAKLYFGDYIILGRDLLEPYLGVYGDRFLVNRRIESRFIDSEGNRHMRVRVGVDVDRFYADLEEKHFIAKPKLRPIVAVLLEETSGGNPTGNSRGRALLEDALAKNEFRIESERMNEYGLGRNIAATPETLREGVEEAQRWDVDAVVTGSLKVQPKADKIVLYDQMFYIDGEITLAIVRADTGEVLREASSKHSSWGLTAEDALKNLLETIVPRAAQELSAGFIAEWSNTMLDKGDFRLLVNGVSPEELTTITNMIETLGPAVELHVKSYYGDVAVLNVFFPGAQRGQLEQFLRKSKSPTFRVRPADERRIEVDVM